MEILGFIPARGGSKRLPGKNIKEFNGKPIIAYPIRYMKSLKITPVVSTEDAEIAEIADRYGAIVVERPKNLADDKTTTTEVLIDFIRGLPKLPEYSLMLHATSVFATPTRIAEALNLIKDGNGVFPMIRYSYPPQRSVVLKEGEIKMFDESAYNKNTQDFTPMYHDAGQFYLLRTKDLLAEQRLFLSKSIPMIIKESEAQDIDNEEDWKLAEMKYEMVFSQGKEGG